LKLKEVVKYVQNMEWVEKQDIFHLNKEHWSEDIFEKIAPWVLEKVIEEVGDEYSLENVQDITKNILKRIYIQAPVIFLGVDETDYEATLSKWFYNNIKHEVDKVGRRSDRGNVLFESILQKEAKRILKPILNKAINSLPVKSKAIIMTLLQGKRVSGKEINLAIPQLKNALQVEINQRLSGQTASPAEVQRYLQLFLKRL